MQFMIASGSRARLLRKAIRVLSIFPAEIDIGAFCCAIFHQRTYISAVRVYISRGVFREKILQRMTHGPAILVIFL